MVKANLDNSLAYIYLSRYPAANEVYQLFSRTQNSSSFSETTDPTSQILLPTIISAFLEQQL